MAGKSGIVQIRNKFLIFFADNVGCGRRERSGSIQYIMLGVWLITEPTGISMYALFTLRIFMVVRVLFIPTYWLC